MVIHGHIINVKYHIVTPHHHNPTWRFMISEVAALLSSPPLSTRWTDSSIEETPSWPGQRSRIRWWRRCVWGGGRMTMLMSLYFSPAPGFPAVVGAGYTPSSCGLWCSQVPQPTCSLPRASESENLTSSRPDFIPPCRPQLRWVLISNAEELSNASNAGESDSGKSDNKDPTQVIQAKLLQHDYKIRFDEQLNMYELYNRFSWHAFPHY